MKRAVPEVLDGLKIMAQKKFLYFFIEKPLNLINCNRKIVGSDIGIVGNILGDGFVWNTVVVAKIC